MHTRISLKIHLGLGAVELLSPEIGCIHEAIADQNEEESDNDKR